MRKRNWPMSVNASARKITIATKIALASTATPISRQSLLRGKNGEAAAGGEQPLRKGAVRQNGASSSAGPASKWSSGGACSARSSFRIESARTSHTRRFTSSFFLSTYSRLRSSPSTSRCVPFVSVLANSPSFPQTTMRCHSVCETYSPDFLSL